MFLLPLLTLLIPNAVLSQSTSIAARVLIYSKTEEFRHDSIPTAIEALKATTASTNVSFDATEDKSQFTDSILSGYDALLMLMNTGEVLDEAGKAALQSYLNKGGNFIAIHSASDCLTHDEFYGKQIGAYFSYHPEITNATVNVIDQSHPATASLPSQWHVRDEMYNFKSDPRSVGAVVLLSADESTYNDDNSTSRQLQGTPHPTAWYQEHGAGVSVGGVAGRSFYTSLGHLNETWKDDTFMSHIVGGILWTLDSNTTKARNASASVGNPSQTSSSSVPAPSQPSSTNRLMLSSLVITLPLLLLGLALY